MERKHCLKCTGPCSFKVKCEGGREVQEKVGTICGCLGQEQHERKVSKGRTPHIDMRGTLRCLRSPMEMVGLAWLC